MVSPITTPVRTLLRRLAGASSLLAHKGIPPEARAIRDGLYQRIGGTRECVLERLDNLVGRLWREKRVKKPHEFRPLRVTLKRQGRDCPVMIERVTVENAVSSLSGELLEEVRAYSSRLRPTDTLFILLLKTLDGRVEGIGISTLIRYGDQFLMRCDRDRKLDLHRQTGIQGVGLAILIARLRFMKQNGYWYPRTQLLFEYDPHVLNAYLKRCDLPVFDPFGLGLHSVTREMGELLLSSCPLDFQEVP